MMTTAALLLAMIASSPKADAGEPVLLDFNASWCGPCRSMRPAIDQLVQKGYRVKSIDIDRSPDLAERYNVTSVPTFIVVSPSGQTMARTMGLQPALDLANLYRKAKAELAADAPEPAADDPATEAAAVAVSDAPADAPAPEVGEAAGPSNAAEPDPAPAPFANPKPWETVVRIKVHDAGALGLGSGTIIYSSPQESIILTCAHIFKLQGGRQVHPSQFRTRITVDLFDGKLTRQKPQRVNTLETVEGEAVDYDFKTDVGLIRIRPGRRLPASRVVPVTWKPEPKTPMITVGCSEGRDATPWSTRIEHPLVRGLVGNPNYEAIECAHAPLQGRSGGGLYTTDGYVAGVCDFAEPRGNHGLYATPRSIHRLLDRNRLTALYAPPAEGPGTMLADAGARPRRASAPTIARAQSPDRDESGQVMIPDPALLNIEPPTLAKNRSRRTAWQSPSGSGSGSNADAPSSVAAEPEAHMAELNVDRSADGDAFGALGVPREPSPPAEEAVPVRTPRPSKWRPVRTAPASNSAG